MGEDIPIGLVGKWLAWKVGKGKNIKIGKDTWVECSMNYRLSTLLINTLHNKGIFNIEYAMVSSLNSLWGQD
jgi:hypothetical protein